MDNGQPMDPEVRLAILRLVENLDQMEARLKAAWERPARPGTPFASDRSIHESRFVRIHAWQAVSSSIDHIRAWKLLVECGRIPITSHLTLLRSSLEGSVRARWLLDKRLAPLTRVARGYAAKRDDFEEHQKFQESRGQPHPKPGPKGMWAAERIPELDKKRSDAGIPVVGYADTTSLMVKYDFERWYRLASAAAHGKEWALSWSEIQAAAAPLAPGISYGEVWASDEIALTLTDASIEAVGRALEAVEAYVGT